MACGPVRVLRRVLRDGLRPAAASVLGVVPLREADLVEERIDVLAGIERTPRTASAGPSGRARRRGRTPRSDGFVTEPDARSAEVGRVDAYAHGRRSAALRALRTPGLRAAPAASARPRRAGRGPERARARVGRLAAGPGPAGGRAPRRPGAGGRPSSSSSTAAADRSARPAGRRAGSARPARSASSRSAAHQGSHRSSAWTGRRSTSATTTTGRRRRPAGRAPRR